MATKTLSKTKESNWIRFLIEISSIVLIYWSGAYLSKTNNLISFLWMTVFGVAIFLYFAISRKNLLDMRAVLVGIMTFSLGVCQLRLSSIQKVWEDKTWICYILGLVFFLVGFFVFHAFLKKKADMIQLRLPKKWSRISYKFHPKRVYFATIFLAVMPIVLFCIQAAIKGFIPIFVRRYDAYILFYTRMSIFINLVILSAPLAFWCLKNLELKRYQRVLMWTIIPLPTIIFQLMVQRGLFIWSICILLVMVYFQSKRKWLGVSAICLLLVFGVLFSTAMRSISPNDYKTLWDLEENITLEPEEPNESGDNDDSSIVIKVPTFLYAPYYYVINGLENFNYLVSELDQHSYGLRQLSPFTVILRFQFLKDMIAEHPPYDILPNSTACIITDFYYDFGISGVIIEMILFGIACAFVQFLYNKKKSPCAALTYGVFMCLCLTSFFAAWISEFGTWLFWGGSLLVFIYVFFSIVPSSKKRRNTEDYVNE